MEALKVEMWIKNHGMQPPNSLMHGWLVIFQPSSVQGCQSDHLSVEWTVLENGIKSENQIYMKVTLIYLFAQMRFKLILPSNNRNVSDYEVNYIKLIQTIFILADTYKIWFRSWVQTKQFYAKANKHMG